MGYSIVASAVSGSELERSGMRGWYLAGHHCCLDRIARHVVRRDGSAPSFSMAGTGAPSPEKREMVPSLLGVGGTGQGIVSSILPGDWVARDWMGRVAAPLFLG